MNEALYLVGFAAAWTVAILYDNHNEVVKVEDRARAEVAAARATPPSCVRAALVASRDEVTVTPKAFGADEEARTARAAR